ncbi:MAG: hypothetical protein FJX71_01890 [Alphaproteobacteria bacterium]|nr:hypothetical protein [Alphaproteobacteria bacterium]
MHIRNLSFFSKSSLIWSLLAILAIGLPLLNAWFGFPLPTNLEGRYSAIGGIIPYSDAEIYLLGAQKFNEFNLLDPWNMRRPLTTLLLAFYLKLTYGNFWYCLIAQASLCALALAFYLNTLRKEMGTLATLTSLFFIYYYIQAYIQTTLSETLGLTLGLFSCVLLWNGWLQKKRSIYNCGMAILAVALSARAGPNFIPLALLVLVFWEPFTHSRTQDTFISFISFFLPFVFISMLSPFYGEPSGSGLVYANFGSTLYGLVTGGRGWLSAYNDPHMVTLISGLNETQLTKIFYSESWNAFKENPFNLVLGMAKYLRGFFSWFIIQFAFGTGIFLLITKVASCVFWLFMAMRIYRQRLLFPRAFLLLLLIFCGIVASAMVVFKDGGMRTFAVAIPFMGALLGFAFLRPSARQETKRIENNWVLASVVPLIMAATVGHKILIKNPPPYIPSLQADLLPNESTILTYNPNKQPYLFINTHPGFHFRSESKDNIRNGWNIYAWSDNQIAEELRRIVYTFKNNNLVLLLIYDYISHSFRWILAEDHILNVRSEWIVIRASIIDKEYKRIHKANNVMELPHG